MLYNAPPGKLIAQITTNKVKTVLLLSVMDSCCSLFKEVNQLCHAVHNSVNDWMPSVDTV